MAQQQAALSIGYYLLAGGVPFLLGGGRLDAAEGAPEASYQTPTTTVNEGPYTISVGESSGGANVANAAASSIDLPTGFTMHADGTIADARAGDGFLMKAPNSVAAVDVLPDVPLESVSVASGDLKITAPALELNPVKLNDVVPNSASIADSTSIRAQVLSNIADSQAARASSQFEQLSRYETAYNFYADAGFSADRAAGHLAGIDFTQPVTLTELTPGTNYLQYPMGGKMGNYFTTVGTPAEAIGINPAGRVPTLYTPTITVPALQSTAADILDTWTVPSQPYMTQGGGIQYFVPNKGVFMQVPNP